MPVQGIKGINKREKPSKLDTASKILGSLKAAGSIAGQISDFTGKDPSAVASGEDALKRLKKTGDFSPHKGVKTKVTGVA